MFLSCIAEESLVKSGGLFPQCVLVVYPQQRDLTLASQVHYLMQLQGVQHVMLKLCITSAVSAKKNGVLQASKTWVRVISLAPLASPWIKYTQSSRSSWQH